MNHSDYLHLSSQREAVRRMLAATPEDEVIDRYSLQARLEQIEAALQATPLDEREPARARLTFNGRPVVGRHGILADFGLRAVNSFAEAVAQMAAALVAPLAASGPIPNREQYQLLITNTALGSFGFELEEFRSSQLTLDDVSPVAQALESTQTLLRSTLGNDEELADAASEIHPRVLEKVRGFLEVLADHEATCHLQLQDRVVGFDSVEQVRASLGRLSRDNLCEQEQTLRGEFCGVLPHSRAFEFRVAPGAEIVRGKVAPGIPDIEQINRYTGRETGIRVMQTRVGKGRPRYLLLALPDWQEGT